MDIIIHFLVAIFATSIGSLTGMGGGVIIKPVLDAFGTFSAANIGVLSSMTVLAMSVVSVAKQVRQKKSVQGKTALPMAMGAVVGGVVGQWLFSFVTSVFSSDNTILIIQNSILAALIIVIFMYMRHKDKLPTLDKSGAWAGLVTGLMLGMISSFLGIGGGPINIAIIMFVFSFDAKMAAVYSLVIILFSQISKVVSIAMSTGFLIYDFSMLPAMIVGAILGGFIGTHYNKKFTIKKVEQWFNATQILVFLLCFVNIARLVL